MMRQSWMSSGFVLLFGIAMFTTRAYAVPIVPGQIKVVEATLHQIKDGSENRVIEIPIGGFTSTKTLRTGLLFRNLNSTFDLLVTGFFVRVFELDPFIANGVANFDFDLSRLDQIILAPGELLDPGISLNTAIPSIVLNSQCTPSCTQDDGFLDEGGFLDFNTFTSISYSFITPQGFKPGEGISFFNFTAVPEPATLALFAVGLAALGMTRRREYRKNKRPLPIFFLTSHSRRW